MRIASINYQLINQVGTNIYQSVNFRINSVYDADFLKIEKELNRKASEIKEKYGDELYLLEINKYF